MSIYRGCNHVTTQISAVRCHQYPDSKFVICLKLGIYREKPGFLGGLGGWVKIGDNLDGVFVKLQNIFLGLEFIVLLSQK